MNENGLRVLLVDDEESLRLPLKKYLEQRYGYQVTAVENGHLAWTYLAEVNGRCDVALIDQLLLDGPSGIEVLREIKDLYPDVECIILTGWGAKDRQDALQAGAFRYLEKPFDNDELAMLIRTAAQQVRLRAISRDILSDLNLEQMLAGIIAAARSLALADEAAIILLDPATNRLERHTQPHPPEERWDHHFNGQPLTRQIIRSGKPVSIPDVMKDARIHARVHQAGFHSFIGVPIPGEKESLGVLYVYSREPRHFDDWGTAALLQTLAGQAGLAIANAQAFQQIHAHAGYMDALVQAGQGFTQTTDPGEQLALAWNFVRQQFQVSTFFIARWDPASGQLTFPLAYDEGRPITIDPRLLSDDPATWTASGYVVKTGQELRWDTLDSGERTCQKLGITSVPVGSPPEPQSCFYLPLKTGETITGCISIQSSQRRAFSDILLDAFRALSNQLAVALENARLFQAEARRRQEAETLREASLALTTTLDQEKIFENILGELQKVVPYDSASVQLLRGEQLEIIGGRGFPNLGQLIGFTFQVNGANPNREVVARRTPHRVPDAPAAYPHFAEEPHVQAGIRSWLGVPMLVGNRLTGMIALDKREPAFYTEEHARLAQAFAAQAAFAVENAHLFQEAGRRGQLLGTLDEVLRRIRAEKETGRLLHECMRLGAQLVGCRAGCLLIHRPYLRELEVIETYGLPEGRPFGPPEGLRGVRLPNNRGLAGWVAQTGQARLVEDYATWSEREILFSDYSIQALAGVPLKHVGDVEAVLLVADLAGEQALNQTSLEVLERFAVQAAIALQTSRLMTSEQRRISQLSILHQITDYIQSAGDLDKILHVVLTGVTAGYGLAFNRAALFLLDERRECLVGRMGIGHIDEAKARSDWSQHHADRREDFRRYIELLRSDQLQLTPVGERVQGMRLPANPEACGFFLEVMAETRCIVVGEKDFARLPARFVHAYQPAHPLVVAPLVARGLAIGVLVADNKFTQFAVSEDDKELLMTFANSAAVAIDNVQLYVNQAALAYDNARRIKELEYMRCAAEALAGAAGLPEVLEQIVHSARTVLQADSAATWSYDDVRDQFILDGSIADGIPPELWQEFRREEPRAGRTADTVMKQGWVGVTAVDDKEQFGFLGDSTRQLLGRCGVQSFQGISLTVGEERLGVLYVNYNHQRSFSEKEQETARTFANHAALALKKARLLEQVRKARDVAKVVAEVSTLEELGYTLNLIVNGSLEALDCDAVTVYTYDPERQAFGFPPAMAGVRDEEAVLAVGQVFPQSVVWNILGLEQAHEAEKTPQDNLLRGKFVDREGIRSSVGIPLRVGDSRVGVMFVNYRSFHRFTQDEMVNINLFANQAAVAIRNTQLYQAEQRYRKALVAIHETSAAISAELHLERLLPVIVEKAAQIFQGPAASLMLWDSGRRYLTIQAAWGLSESYCREQRILAETITHHYPSPAGSQSFVFDIHEQPLGDPALVHQEGLRTAMVAPLVVGEELIGILNVYSKDSMRGFDAREQELSRILANHTAIAIQNARAYRDLKRTKSMIASRTALAWLGMASSVWRHTIDKHAVTIRDLADLLEKDPRADRQAERLTRISRLAKQILEKPITPPLSTESGLESVPVNALIGERARQLWTNDPYRKINLILELRLPDGVTVWASPEWLRRAFDIFVENAAKAVGGQAVQEITIGTCEREGEVEIWIADSGAGIPPEQQARLGQEWIKKPEDAQGLGMGLLMAQTILQTFGGEFKLGKTGPDGTTMRILLPCEQR